MQSKSLQPKIIICLTILLVVLSFTPNQVVSNNNVIRFSPSTMTIKSHQTEIDIYSTSEISSTENFVVQNIENTTIDSIDLWLNYSLNTLIVEDGEGTLNYDWNVITNTSNLVRVYFRTSLDENDTASFTLNYNINYSLKLLEDQSSYYSFEFYSTISHLTQNYKMTIKLPERSFIHEFEDTTYSFYPTNASQVLIQNRIEISWNYENLIPSSNPLYIVRFDEPVIPEDEIGFFESKFAMFLAGILVGIFLGISGISWLIRHREKKAMKKMGATLLTENQRTLIRIVYERKGKVSQKELCDITGYSKSKISRNLVPLEEKGLIRRDKFGRTYVVYLTDDGIAVIE
ncbi:MAG: helix-turn-helix transcriptional regulator [Candidatus Thorarchaeota archaeon]